MKNLQGKFNIDTKQGWIGKGRSFYRKSSVSIRQTTGFFSIPFFQVHPQKVRIAPEELRLEDTMSY